MTLIRHKPSLDYLGVYLDLIAVLLFTSTIY